MEARGEVYLTEEQRRAASRIGHALATSFPEERPEIIAKRFGEASASHGLVGPLAAQAERLVLLAIVEARPFQVSEARYAQSMMLVRVTSDSSGVMTRAARLCRALRARYTNRERGYVMSPRKVERLRELYAAGWDGRLVFDSVSRTRYELEPPRAPNPSPGMRAKAAKRRAKAAAG